MYRRCRLERLRQIGQELLELGSGILMILLDGKLEGGFEQGFGFVAPP